MVRKAILSLTMALALICSTDIDARAYPFFEKGVLYYRIGDYEIGFGLTDKVIGFTIKKITEKCGEQNDNKRERS